MEDEELVALMSIYYSEWEHRDNILWSQAFKLFYANLLVIVFPYIADYLDIELPVPSMLVFGLIGAAFSFVFLYICLGYAKRLEASGKTYAKIMKRLREPYWRCSIKELKHGRWFSYPLANVLVFAMFFVLLILSIAMIVLWFFNVGK